MKGDIHSFHMRHGSLISNKSLKSYECCTFLTLVYLVHIVPHADDGRASDLDHKRISLACPHTNRIVVSVRLDLPAKQCPQLSPRARRSEIHVSAIFSDFYETLPFNYDSPVPEGGMREGGRNGSVIRWSWGGWRSSRAYHMIREGTGRGREERGVFRNKHSSIFRRPYMAPALRCQEVRIRISFTDFSFKRV